MYDKVLFILNKWLENIIVLKCMINKNNFKIEVMYLFLKRSFIINNIFISINRLFKVVYVIIS